MATIDLPSVPLTFNLGSTVHLGEAELFELCAANPELRIERNAQGDLTVMTPAGGASSLRNTSLTLAVAAWAAEHQDFLAFDSSAGFVLPNGAMRSPDGAVVARSRVEAIPPEARERFLHLCPDLVVEIRSPSDSLPELLAKMEEYRDSGARLGWLIDPYERRVHVFDAGRPVQVLVAPAILNAGIEFPGLVVQLERIWDPFA